MGLGSSAWTDEELNTLRAMQGAGHSFSNIVDALPNKTFYKIRSRMSLEQRQLQKFTSEERQQIEKLRDEGMIYEQVHRTACQRLSFHTFAYLIRNGLHTDSRSLARLDEKIPYTYEHDNTIKSLNSDGCTVSDIARSLGRTSRSVYGRMRVLGVKHNRHRPKKVPWTEDEIRRLQLANDDKKKLKEMIALFPTRSDDSVMGARQSLLQKQGKTQSLRPRWTVAEEAQLLHLQNEGLNLPAIASNLKRTMRAVESKLYELGRRGLRRDK